MDIKERKDSEDIVNESATKRIKHSPSNSMDYHKSFDMSAPTMFDFKGHGLLPQYSSNGMTFPGLHNSHFEGHNSLLMSFGARPPHPGMMYDFQGQMNPTHSPAPPPKSPSPPPRVYKPCVVCNDKSSGYHYGVSSCEGCKGFFRRSVQKNIQYTCQKDSNCEINKVTRNRCQHCRLKKCFEKGMSKEAVRNDRKKKPQDATDTTNNNYKPEQPVNHITSKDEALIEKIMDAHRASLPGGPYLLKRKGSVCQSPSIASPVPSTCSNMTGESSDNKPSPDTTTYDSMGGLNSPATPGSSLGSPSRRPGWENVQELSSEGIVKVVEFAKKIPNFLDLSVTDQITLLKASCLEIIILRLAMRYNMDEEILTFSNGVSVNVNEMEKGGFGALAHTIFKFSSSLYDMDLDEKEFALLSVICLLSSDRSGLENSKEVEKVQEPYLDALRNYARQMHPKKPHLFAKLLTKLTDLRSISIKGAEKVLHLKHESSDNIPPLVVEMFERPENVCIE